MEEFGQAIMAFMPYLVAGGFAVLVFGALWFLKRLALQLPTKDGLDIQDFTNAAVLAVEQMFFEKDGEFKRAEVVRVVRKIFPGANETELMVWIEAAVRVMKANGMDKTE
jgi:hypothetical protein